MRMHTSQLRSVGRGLLWIWAPASIVVVAALMMSHLLAFPTPAVHVVEAGLALTRPLGGWRAIHVLFANCPCSRRVADALVARGAREDFAEQVLFVGTDEPLTGRLRASRFGVEDVTREELQGRFGIEAAPAFFAAAPDGTVRYLGGYSHYKQGPTEDLRLLTLVRLGLRPDPLPLFGCAVSRELAARADPLGLYSSAENAK
jgi:hypothetical protein